MLVRVLLAAILAGVLGGVFATGAQSLRVTPLIIEAESYEGSEGHHHHGETPVADEEVASGDEEEEWGPADGLERTFYTLVSNIVVGVGFSLVVTAGILLVGKSVSLTTGLAWGLAGFITFVLAPAAGLPPELPGTAAAELSARQIWWLATVVLTGAGLWLLAFRREPLWIVAALVLIAAPHLYGAPHPASHEMLAPAHLSVEFAIASIATGFAFWLFLGGVLGFLLDRALQREAAETPEAAA